MQITTPRHLFLFHVLVDRLCTLLYICDQMSPKADESSLENGRAADYLWMLSVLRAVNFVQ